MWRSPISFPGSNTSSDFLNSQLQTHPFHITFCNWLHRVQALLITFSHCPPCTLRWRHYAISFHHLSCCQSAGVSRLLPAHPSTDKLPRAVQCCCQGLPSEAFWQPSCQLPDWRNDTSLTFKGNRLRQAHSWPSLSVLVFPPSLLVAPDLVGFL